MNICILTHNYPLRPGDGKAAAGLFVPDFARQLKKQGHKVCIFTPDVQGEKENAVDLPVKWFDWAGGDRKLGHLKLLSPFDSLKLLSLYRNGSKEVIKFARAEQIDVCLALWAIPSGFFAYMANKKIGIPYSVWALGSDIWTYSKYPIVKQVVRKVLKQADLLFADGIKLSKDVEALCGRRCKFLPTSRILPLECDVKVEIDKTNANFLFIGRWEKAKGIDILIDAMHLLIQEGFKANLYVFGGGTLENHLNRSIRRYKLEENVFLGGYASPSMVVSYMRQCDCLVIPSRVESIPIIFSDALQVGIPVIVSDVGDMGYLAKKYKVGNVVSPQDPNELKEAMAEFIEGVEWTKCYAGNELLAEMFNLSKIVSRYLSHF